MAVRLQLVAHRLDVDAELTCSRGLVVPDTSKGLEDQCPLRFRERDPGTEADAPVTAALAAQVRRKVAWLDPARTRDDHRTLDHVPQLAHVARPRRIPQDLHRLRAHTMNARAVLRVELADEVLREQRNVAAALPQRRQHDREHAQPVDRKSTRLNSSHVRISYAVFCLKKKNI